MSISPDPVLGEVHSAEWVVTNRPRPGQARRILLLLTACVSLMMTGFGIIMPVFARRLAELGAGVEALGWMTVAFALAQMVTAPFLGAMADRYGRRPLVLLSLAAFTLTNLGYLWAPSTLAFIVIRGLGGGLTAGLFPATMGVVADIFPERQRARWIGIVMGGYGAGFVFGPVLGGLLYDAAGFGAPFLLSAGLAGLGFVAALFLVPETRTAQMRRRVELRRRRLLDRQGREKATLWQSLPRPLSLFGALLLVDFMGNFTFAYVEPQMVFYLYEELNWSTTQFGLVVGGYGLAMMIGQIFLGQLSDRLGRKPVILAGIAANATFFVGLAVLRSFWVMMGAAIVAGLGIALIAPAAGALYLDMTPEAHRSRVMGFKGSAVSLGGVLGPLLVVAVSRLLGPVGIFLSAAAFMGLAFGIALIFLRRPSPVQEIAGDLAWEIARQRSLAAQASLRGLVMEARAGREGDALQ